LAEDDVDHPIDQLLLVGYVVVERHRGDAELVGELAHRQPLDAMAVGERHCRLQHALPAQRCARLGGWFGAHLGGCSVYPPSVILHRKANLPYSVRRTQRRSRTCTLETPQHASVDGAPTT